MPRSRDRVVLFVLFFRDHGRSLHELSGLARRVCDPADALYGRYMTRARLARLVAPRPEVVERCRRWFTRKGMQFGTLPHPQVAWAATTLEGVRRVFGPECEAWLRDDQVQPPRHAWPLPDEIGGHLKSISATSIQSGDLARTVKGMVSDGPPPRIGRAIPPRAAAAGMTPADIRSIYNFSPEWTGKGETIGLLNIGGQVNVDDAMAFWRRHGIEREPPTMVNLASIPPGGLLERLEPTMGVEWIGAMAPGARIFLYNIDYRAAADPWVAFVAAALSPSFHGQHPTILVSTWSLPERMYAARHGRGVFADLLEQAAVTGVTFIAASGDWGLYDGRPSTQVDDLKVADAPWPHGVFPSVEDYVLSVGGTMIPTRDPLTEVAWSGPLPPNDDLRRAMPFLRLASSGGFSEDVDMPWWQQDTLRPRGIPRHFPRGLNIPAVLPSGRGYPDVALMAQGAAIAYGDGLASVGYEAHLDGQTLNWAGGTSLAAPIWAAIIARMNQARRSAGLPRAGFVNPVLYRLAAQKTARPPFRPITVGDSDVEMRVVSQHRPTSFLLEGYSASRGWNPVTGLGVPHVQNLIDASIHSLPRRRRAGA